jgi:hypothetical protein
VIPKEHGAYGQLLFPLLTALGVGRPRLAPLALVGAAVAAFGAHEPLLVLMGRRGGRAARERRVEAWRWLVAFAGTAAALGLAAFVAMPDTARVALLVPVSLASVLGALIALRREHTAAGEIVSALSLSSLALPAALAAQVSFVAALTCTLAFAAAFVSAIVCVRPMVAWAQGRAGPWTRVTAGALAAGGVAGLAVLSRAGAISGSGPWAALPVCGVGLWLVVAPPSPRHLRRVGWTLVGATIVTAVVLVLGLRQA